MKYVVYSLIKAFLEGFCIGAGFWFVLWIIVNI